MGDTTVGDTTVRDTMVGDATIGDRLSVTRVLPASRSRSSRADVVVICMI